MGIPNRSQIRLDKGPRGAYDVGMKNEANTVTESRILDLLTTAVHATLRGAEDGASWTFMHMTLAERLAFDLFLVRVKDPLAYEAGTTERRFKTRVARMAHLARTGELPA